jgi:phosphatidylglycerophosphate synthase
MTTLKYIADFLTFSRLLIAAILGLMGWILGPDSLQFALILMIYAWASDIIDGSLARRSRVSVKTWIGDHDLYFDMSVAAGLLIYLTTAGYLNTPVSIFYILLWSLLFWWFGIFSALGKLFQTPIYTWFLFVMFRYEPIFAVVIIFFLLIAIVFTWPRFHQETVPEFLSGFDNVKPYLKDDPGEEINGVNGSLDENRHHRLG